MSTFSVVLAGQLYATIEVEADDEYSARGNAVWQLNRVLDLLQEHTFDFDTCEIAHRLPLTSAVQKQLHTFLVVDGYARENQ